MKILVVGLGSMGRRRLRNLVHLGGHELAGVEPQDERRAEVAAEFSIPAFASFDEGLAWEPQALVISTPPDAHTPYAIEAAKRGIHFFTEASVVEDGMVELAGLVEGAAIVAAPSCTMRFHPSVRLLSERIAAGSIGRVLAATHHVGQYLPDWHPWEDYRKFYVSRRETGATREIVPFELSWLTYVLGPIDAVSAMKAKVSDLEADIDDIYASLLRFQSGVHAQLLVDVLARPGVRQARILGSEGTLTWDWQARLVREHRAGEDGWEDFPEPPPISGPGGEWVAENMYIEEMRGYTGAIAGTAVYPYSVAEDRAVLGLLASLERSSDEGRVIEIGS